MIRCYFDNTKAIFISLFIVFTVLSLSAACLAVPALGESESGVTGKGYTGTLFAIDFPKARSGEQKWTINNADGFLEQNVPVDGEILYGAVAPTG